MPHYNAVYHFLLYPRLTHYTPLCPAQVPCNLREGDERTYNDKGDNRVWIAGNKNDDGKRFCTLQLAARCHNGDPTKPRRGQPKITIVFRGQGARLSQREKDAWHKDVNVRFQPKAWFDDSLCLKYAEKEMGDICEDAKRNKRQSVVICDNLSGQTTQGFADALRVHNCKRHLLPSGVTDELQLIDDGVGKALKNEMGNLFDTWAMEPGNLERWTAEGGSAAIVDGAFAPMAAWEKRVLITQLAAEAWENICARFDFEKAATRLGMRMTVNGDGDDLIKIQGMENYSFSDRDGGEDGDGTRSDDEGFDEDLHADIDEDVEGTVSQGGEEDDDPESIGNGNEQRSVEEHVGSFEGGTDESDCDSSDGDDTADPDVVRTSIGNAVAPPGFNFVDVCPPLHSAQDRQEMIGKSVFVGWDTDDIYGWYIGTIHSTNISARDLQKTPTANFVVKYTKQKTKDAINGCVACELSARLYGVSKWWLILEKE